MQLCMLIDDDQSAGHPLTQGCLILQSLTIENAVYKAIAL